MCVNESGNAVSLVSGGERDPPLKLWIVHKKKVKKSVQAGWSEWRENHNDVSQRDSSTPSERGSL